MIYYFIYRKNILKEIYARHSQYQCIKNSFTFFENEINFIFKFMKKICIRKKEKTNPQKETRNIFSTA